MSTERTSLLAPAPAADPEPAAPEDAPRIAEILAAAAPETIPLGPDEVRAQLDRFTVLRGDDGEVVAVAALHPVDEDRTELRSVAVDTACRGRGMGRTLVSRVLEQVVEEGRKLFCFTFRPGFFRGLGFRPVSDADLPRRSGRPARLGGQPRLAMAFSPVPQEEHPN